MRRGLARYVEDLLRQRRPRPFAPTDDEVSQVRAAVTLRAARPGSGAPGEEFVAALQRRLAAEQALMTGEETGRARVPTRRRALAAGAGVAAASAALGAGLDRAASALVAAEGGAPASAPRLAPDRGVWTTVAATSDLPEGGVRPFDLGTLNGYVQRVDGRLHAVSGVCTHLGCRLALTDEGRVDEGLACPCHRAVFALSGHVLRHELSTAPAPLPRFAVREENGSVQIFAPA